MCSWQLDDVKLTVKVLIDEMLSFTAQKLKISIKYFLRKFPADWSHLLKKSFMENFIFCAVFCKQSHVHLHIFLPKRKIRKTLMKTLRTCQMTKMRKSIQRVRLK